MKQLLSNIYDGAFFAKIEDTSNTENIFLRVGVWAFENFSGASCQKT